MSRRLVVDLLYPRVRFFETGSLEGRLTHEQSVHYAADTPNVDLVRMPDLRQYLGGYIVRRSAQRSVKILQRLIID